MAAWSLTGRYIFPVDRPALQHGLVVIDGKTICAVEPHGTRSADVDLGNVAIIPGLVNAHTHLDLTGLFGKCPPTVDFTQWLRGVVAHRRTQTPGQVQDDIKAGLAMSTAAGTTLLGGIASGGASWDALANTRLRAVVFRELLGLSGERGKQAWADTRQWQNGRSNTPTCRMGLSPHAPFSVNIGLIRTAAENGCPVAIHLAETTGELELLAHHTGPFRDFLAELGVWDPSGLAASVEDVVLHSSAAARILFVHANYLSPAAVIPAYATIVYCPRTHAAFGHPPHPFREFLKRGVRVALGTDSLASNPDLDILAEMRFVHQRHPDVPGDVLLRMATHAGAEALGWADETGSLTPGKSADLAVVPLADAEGDPYELLLTSPHRVARTLFRGQWTAPAGLAVPAP